MVEKSQNEILDHDDLTENHDSVWISQADTAIVAWKLYELFRQKQVDGLFLAPVSRGVLFRAKSNGVLNWHGLKVFHDHFDDVKSLMKFNFKIVCKAYLVVS